VSPALGTLVEGVDLTAPIDQSTAEVLRQALLDHHLLLVRGQEVDDEQHVAFARVFGRIAVERSEVGTVSNQPGGTLGPVAACWHSDYMFFPEPYECISLYGVEIPSAGTQTSFANGVAAARTLPEDLRVRIDGLEGRAVADIAAGGAGDEIRYRLGRVDGVDPHQLRPVLWPHHETGEPILAVWEQQTDAILPLPQEESVALIETLFAHLYQPSNVYVHDWQPLDLIIWDNHALQHSRGYIGTDEPRTLRRVCVGQDQDIAQFAPAAAVMA
jgi:taurine dioxygenase